MISAILFLGFGLKASVSVAGKYKCSNISMEMESKSSAEEGKNSKEDKSGRSSKKMCYFDVPNLHQLAYNPTTSEAHNRVYLLAIISEPYLSIPIEPPEMA
ncbi:hypothetical protein MKQ68_17970 [Chitinophaga horti]|uniref:Uncharacterized protein n=1 Tax=Chitinophaga horti TaxID=2920382 RepID=A0ABY6IXF0_9BACT|nr:hypothetical protein [Chitinophaga horti]UYQ91975.1 hypothetical protein MKQ68_17970 [Chitinophaga horti]